MAEFEIDWMFFIVLFLVFITAGLVTGKNEHDKKLKKEKQKVDEIEEENI